MRKCANISPYMRRPLVIYHFATAPFWITWYIRKIWVSFLSVYLWWHSILVGGPEACQRAPNIGVPLSATICEQLAAICGRYLPMVTQNFGWMSWGLPKQLFVSNLLPFVSDIYLWGLSILAGGPEASQSNYLWATCCHLWVIVTYGDTAFWLQVMKLATKAFPLYWIATFINYLWATCCQLWAIVTYGDTAFWLEVLRLAKGFPVWGNSMAILYFCSRSQERFLYFPGKHMHFIINIIKKRYTVKNRKEYRSESS